MESALSSVHEFGKALARYFSRCFSKNETENEKGRCSHELITA